MFQVQIKANNQSGASTLLVITMIMLLGLLGGALTFLSVTELNMAAGNRDGMAALYLAEAGAKHALVELSFNPQWKPEPNNSYVEGGGHYSLQIASGSPTIIEVTGRVNQAVRKVVLRVTIASDLESSTQHITINSWNYH